MGRQARRQQPKARRSPLHDIAIITAVNTTYLPYLAVQLSSANENAAPTTCFDMTILHTDVIEADRFQLSALVDSRHRVRWFEFNTDLVTRLGAPPELAECNSYYLSLLGPYILADRDRAIYLDADVLVLGDLAPLWNEPLDGKATGAVRDLRATFEEADSYYQELGLPGNTPYFNAGMFLMDLEQWRDTNIPGETWGYAQRHPTGITATSPHGFNQWDQYSYNLTMIGRWKELSFHWNYSSERPMPPDLPTVVHFLGKGKPGSPTCRDEFTARFFEVLSRTPFRNWRP